MKFFKLSLFFLFAFVTSFSAQSQSETKNFELNDLRELSKFSQPQVSPDGKYVAVVVSKPDWELAKNKQVLYLISLADGSIRKLSSQRESLSEVHWAPQGDRLGFVSKDMKTKHTQVFVMPMNGGDALQITKSKTGIEEFSWSPDGKSIAYVAQDTVPNPKAIKHNEDVFRVSDNNFLVRKIPQPWHLWMVSAQGGQAKRLTKGSWSLETDQGSISPLAWAKDGQSIAFQQFPDVWEGNAFHSVIASVDTAATIIDTLVGALGSSSPAYSADGKYLAFSRARGGDLNNGQAVYVVHQGKTEDITAQLAHNINRYAWLPNQKALLLAAYKGTQSIYWVQKLDASLEQLDLGKLNASSRFSLANNGLLVFNASSSEKAEEVYVYDPQTSKPRALTSFNAFVQKRRLGKSEAVEWKLKSFHEDGVLTYPSIFEKGKKYPLVLLIHGGPESASTLGFSPLAQLLAAEGFLVFQPNYRGSTNLGDAYQHAIYRNTGKGPGQDVMAGLKKLIDRGIVDESRIGVTGWSYGGYMTSWLIGNYPDVWKAAVSGAALNDWVADYTVSYYQKGDLYFFGGSPWVKEYWKIWREQSPIAYATKVKAPTLIMGCVGDPNVPLINGYQLFHALRDNGVEVEFYAYPVDTHFPHDIVRTTDVYRRWVGWMVKYLK
jgi:dipeptidyl aminopeptidase/acylaminoacyl peptidase